MPREYSKRDEYINTLFAPEDDLLQDITHSQTDAEFSMQISPYEGKIIYLLLKMIGAKDVVEIGMLAGYSATWIARALPDDGKLYSFERTAHAVDKYKRKIAGSKIEPRIEFIVGDARENLVEFNTQVDAVFIDADKASYPEYFKHAKRILKQGGLLIADNVFLFGNAYEEPLRHAKSVVIQNIKQFNKLVAQNIDFESVILPTSEGLLIARKI
ncbi:MAG: mycolic acid cyclopropane synthetase family protein [Candidatus Midichloriaceae bacterium]|jgi:predicted O-methyltransferase YrrM|nr:mycolic acid cyclopropane synthetase family protein [Candidatus Midichloriaceae bacterium]